MFPKCSTSMLFFYFRVLHTMGLVVELQDIPGIWILGIIHYKKYNLDLDQSRDLEAHPDASASATRLTGERIACMHATI